MQNIRKAKLSNGNEITLSANFDTYLCYKQSYGICIEDAKIEFQRMTAKMELLTASYNAITKPTANDIDTYYDGVKALQDAYNGISDKRLCVAMIQAAGDTRTAAEIERDVAVELNSSDSEIFKALIELMPILTPELKKNE